MELDRDLVFPPFQSSFTFPVTIINNDIAEASSEGFTIALTRSLSDNLDVEVVEFSRATVAIKEDDSECLANIIIIIIIISVSTIK